MPPAAGNESLVGTKNHRLPLQYLPNKHYHHSGIKFWIFVIVTLLLNWAMYEMRNTHNILDEKSEEMCHLEDLST
jgi:hypothetical protein